ncbi:hypothetical protein AB4Y45_33495 [Paraburkholderia sp. EG287A]|uniref:hypothetical protein n=1 Tax=Paraburkholderia sp. EG287A TaxID=3237012 RepID=UPI0034D26374
MREAEISTLPGADSAREPVVADQPFSLAEWCCVALGGVLFLAMLVFLNIWQTPTDTLRNEVFPVVVEPFGLSAASDMVDTNTWLTVHWDRTYLQSLRTGKVSVTVDIVSSLPVRALNANADRDTYLQMFGDHQLHRVAERATLTLERDGLGWRLAGAAPEQFDAQARTRAYLAHTSQGPLTFVADEGVYTDATAYSSMRVDDHHFGGGLTTMVGIGAMLVGALFGVATGSTVPSALGLLTGFALGFGPESLISWLIPGPAALTGAQALGIF